MFKVNVTIFFVTMLVFIFKLKCCVHYSVLAQFFSYHMFDFVAVTVSYNVHCGIIAVTVHTSYMNMVNTFDTVNMKNMLLDFVNIYVLRNFSRNKSRTSLRFFTAFMNMKTATQIESTESIMLISVNRIITAPTRTTSQPKTSSSI